MTTEEAQTEETTAAPHLCLTCHKPTDYQYLCVECSELFLIELWEGGRLRGLKP